MKVITIGRGLENDFVIKDDKVSRIHLQLVEKDNGTYSAVDLNSVNGTFVNGQRITGEYHLHTGDRLVIGDTALPWQTYFPSSIRDTGKIGNNNFKIWLIVAAAVFILLLAGGGVYWKIRHDKKEKDEAVLEFNNLKTQAQTVKVNGGNNKILLDKMKEIAKKYPEDGYFQEVIKELETK